MADANTRSLKERIRILVTQRRIWESCRLWPGLQEVHSLSLKLTSMILQMNVTTNYEVNKTVILQSFKKFMFKVMYNSLQHL
ncbi:hypothetical protein ACB092_06G108600 [Castanea dentata]